MNRRIIILACISAGLLGYGLGLLRGHRRLDEHQVVEAPKARQVKAEPPTERLTEQDTFHMPPDLQVSGIGREELLQQIRSDNPISRMEAFVALAKDLDEESIRAIIDAYENEHFEDDLSGLIILQLLTFAWAQEDPQGALAWAEGRSEFIEQDLAFYSILDSWVRQDPEAALAWAREHYDEKDRSRDRGNELLLGVIQGMSESDLAGATALMTELNYKRYLDKAASILAMRVWAQGEDAAMAWAESLPDGAASDAAFRAIGQRLARDDLDRAMEWVESIGETAVQAEIGKDVARRVASADPVKAAEWVDSMPEGETRSACMERVVKEWVQTDPAATAEWLNQFPNDESIDGSLSIFLHGIVKDDPLSALEWANAITDPKRRARATRFVNSKVERMAE